MFVEARSGASPTAILTTAAAVVGIAVINSVGYLARFVSPYLFGRIIDQTKSTDLSAFTLAVSIALGNLLILVMPTKLVSR